MQKKIGTFVVVYYPSLSFDAHLQIGAVFTPLRWAIWAAEQYQITERWLQGASVLDPTCGEGNLIEALIVSALQKGVSVNELPIHRLYGIELNVGFYEKMLQKFEYQYGIKLSKSNFVQEDVFFTQQNVAVDIIFGNPPWQTFADLPEQYKSTIKSLFFRYGLAENGKELLLGNSRMDIAALVMAKTIAKHLKPQGEAVFFMPMSILLNDGANKYFRNYEVNKTPFAVEEVYDFGQEVVFEQVGTRYGLTLFKRNKKASFPIPYYQYEQGAWKTHVAKPLFHANDPLSILPETEYLDSLLSFEPLILPKSATPRQGINTCGANDMFLFDDYQEVGGELVKVSNKKQQGILLPKKYLFPLLMSKNFGTDTQQVDKWVLLPYQKTGKPLTLTEIEEYPELYDYLHFKKIFLTYRKGVMINSWIKKGVFWALLGVGAYNFLPYKVAWEAYGKREFKPRLFTGSWQANQSLQAYIPAQESKTAQHVLHKLSDNAIEQYLQSLQMQGTMNWAQPGKIKRFIQFTK